ncbi:MAG: hypothetical protein IPN94_16440 [Sphingobacteriales bacterium]|nr:hypothetical protein [Sphingobacteriales bacterium]
MLRLYISPQRNITTSLFRNSNIASSTYHHNATSPLHAFATATSHKDVAVLRLYISPFRHFTLSPLHHIPTSPHPHIPTSQYAHRHYYRITRTIRKPI